MSEINNNASEQAETAQKPKKLPGRPFTSETAKKAQINSAKAHRLRKEARYKILAAVTSKLDLGEEVLHALTQHDEQYLAMLERATRLIGCHFDQSEDAIQNIKVNAKTDTKAKVDTTVRFVLGERPVKQ